MDTKWTLRNVPRNYYNDQAYQKQSGLKWNGSLAQRESSSKICD